MGISEVKFWVLINEIQSVNKFHFSTGLDVYTTLMCLLQFGLQYLINDYSIGYFIVG